MAQSSIIAEFDLANVELAGRNLIEASAGTGKTYAISRLFLRLLLEKRLSVHDILVVTFTEAATQELRDRIYSLIRNAKDAFIAQQSNDPLLEALINRCDIQQALADIDRALGDFDATSIFTIHGFCRRLLYEHAFESGQTFDPEMITDQTELYCEITYDFWRMHFPNASPLFIAYVLENNITPDSFADPLRAYIGSPTSSIDPVPDDPATDAAEQQFSGAFTALAEAWPSAKTEVRTLFSGGLLNGNKYRIASINNHINAMDAFAGSATPQPVLFKAFEKFTTTYVQGAIKKGNVIPQIRFFDVCEEVQTLSQRLSELYEQRILFLKYSFYIYARQELVRRKAIKNILYFDDLLTRVDAALKLSTRGPRLCEAVRNVYHAALIDEFQDTDPVQYAIFNTLFTEATPLFLIGDPKQAIYSFRGADIFAYIQASKAVKRRYTLPVNYRSHPDLITAINTLFGISGNPFVVSDITYSPVRSAEKQYTASCILPGYDSSFTLWHTENNGANKSSTQNDTAKKTAAIIAGILNDGLRGTAYIDDASGTTPVMPSDIAVLVRQNKEAECMQEVLHDLNIPAIIESSGSVFDTPEALYMLRLMEAVCFNKRSGCIKAALATPLFGFTAHDIDEQFSTDSLWDRQIQAFTLYHELWQKYGVMRMLRTCMKNNTMSARLITLPNGERRLTNLLHLAELIHTEETGRRQSMASICSWIGSKIAEDHTRVPDEEMLRLESDDNAIKIITIHRSKGLEYPIVFCPFMWGSSEFSKRRKNQPFMFHNPDANFEPTLALGADAIDTRRPIAETELLAENIRLLYVALTRAKYRCFCTWGILPGSDTSALAYLLFGNRMTDISVADLRAVVDGLPGGAFDKCMENLTEQSQGTISTGVLPDAVPERYNPPDDKRADLMLRSFIGSIPKPWNVASFTGLTAHHAAQTNYDKENFDIPATALLSDEPPAVIPDNLFSFPKGADAGIFFHDLLEHLDFTQTHAPATVSLIESALKQHGFETRWTEHILAMLKDLVALPLHSADPTFTLHTAGPEACMRETEFYFPLRRIVSEDLNDFIALPDTVWKADAKALDFAPSHGYLKGIMDLVVFHHNKAYLIDWKSNFLGNTFESYTRESLARAMEQECYTLQYRLYLAALHRYLALRMPDYDYDIHFGGVAYVFLRGISAKYPGNGVYADRPTLEYVESLCTKLMPS